MKQLTLDFTDINNENEVSLYQISVMNKVPYDVCETAALRALMNETMFIHRRKLASDYDDRQNFIFSPQERKAIEWEIEGAYKCCFDMEARFTNVETARARYPMYKKYGL